MRPNLNRVSGDGDIRAAEILGRVHGHVSRQLLDSLDDRDLLALGRYGARQPTVALRTGSPACLHAALLAAAISQTGSKGDPRDVIVGLALHHIVARQLGLNPVDVFDRVAGCLPEEPIADLLREFGPRQDITLGAFG